MTRQCAMIKRDGTRCSRRTNGTYCAAHNPMNKEKIRKQMKKAAKKSGRWSKKNRKYQERILPPETPVNPGTLLAQAMTIIARQAVREVLKDILGLEQTPSRRKPS